MGDIKTKEDSSWCSGKQNDSSSVNKSYQKINFKGKKMRLCLPMKHVYGYWYDIGTAMGKHLGEKAGYGYTFHITIMNRFGDLGYALHITTRIPDAKHG